MDLELNADSWPEAVLHVLAHVDVAAPASIHAPWYVRFAEEVLGPGSERTLAEDARVLARVAEDHAKLSQLQGVAWSARERADAAGELLRCAALLELDACARLPRPSCNLRELRDALDELAPRAPALASAKLTLFRPLTRHGRVRGDAIWLGVPGQGVGMEHVAMQAAHEATVREVALAGALGERQVEAVALVLLSLRCENSSLHRDWCAAWQLRAEHLDASRLSVEARAVLDARLQR